jgi:hypothetical protein
LSTPFKVPIDAFLKRIEKDRDFFQCINLSERESMALALKRSDNYLTEAIGRLSLCGCNQIDFTDTDNINRVFNNDLTTTEIFLIASIMYEMHLDRDISKIKILSVNYSPTDLRVFDPSNARSTFLEIYNTVRETNLKLIDEYINRNRLTGKLIGVDYAQYDE